MQGGNKGFYQTALGLCFGSNGMGLGSPIDFRSFVSPVDSREAKKRISNMILKVLLNSSYG